MICPGVRERGRERGERYKICHYWDLRWRRVWPGPPLGGSTAILVSPQPPAWPALPCHHQFLDPSRLSMFVPGLARDRKLCQPSLLYWKYKPLQCSNYFLEEIFSVSHIENHTLRPAPGMLVVVVVVPGLFWSLPGCCSGVRHWQCESVSAQPTTRQILCPHLPSDWRYNLPNISTKLSISTLLPPPCTEDQGEKD